MSLRWTCPHLTDHCFLWRHSREPVSQSRTGVTFHQSFALLGFIALFSYSFSPKTWSPFHQRQEEDHDWKWRSLSVIMYFFQTDVHTLPDGTVPPSRAHSWRFRWICHPVDALPRADEEGASLLLLGSLWFTWWWSGRWSLHSTLHHLRYASTFQSFS